MNKTCKNCNSHFKGAYCYNCGQSAHIDPLTFSYLRDNILHIFHIEHKIPFTLKELTLRPGHAIREYIEGKRGKYMNPFAYLTFIGLVYWGVMHIPDLDLASVPYIGTDESQSEETKQRIKFANEAFRQLVYGKYAPLVTLPFIAFATWLAFIKSGANYIKHVVINAYVNAQITIPQLFLLIIESFYKNVDFWIISKTIYVIYLCRVLIQIFNQKSIIRIISLTLLSVFLMYILTFLFFFLGIAYVGGLFNG